MKNSQEAFELPENLVIFVGDKVFILPLLKTTK